jgi:hypothetical protein
MAAQSSGRRQPVKPQKAFAAATRLLQPRPVKSIAIIAAALPLSVCAAAEKPLEAKAAIQAADIIIERSLLATGSRARLVALRDMFGSGVLVLRRPQPGQTAPAEIRGQFAMALKGPDKMRSEFILGGTRRIQLYDGSRGWNVTVAPTGSRMEEMSGQALRKLRLDALDANDRFRSYKRRGLRARLIGPTRILLIGPIEEMRTCSEIEITGLDQPPRRLFFDQQSDLLLKITSGPTETYYGNFREIEGIVTATQMMILRGQEELRLLFTNVQINSGVTDAVFRPQKKT